MRRSRLILVALLLAPLCMGGECAQNPKRPSSLSRQELDSPAYDRFFNLVGKEEVNRIGDDVLRRGGAIVFTKQTPQGLVLDGGKAAACGYKAIEGSTTMALSISYHANKATDPPPMQLVLLVRCEVPEGGFIGELGEQVIICDLNDSQCEHVLEHGIPQPLIDAMVNQAAATGWTEKVPGPGDVRKIGYVSPDEHFKVQ